MITIDGNNYNVPIVGISRKVDFLDKFANRTENGDLKRKLIGVYFNYSLKLGTTLDTDEYDRLFDKLTEPVEFHTVMVPGAGGNFTFTAYFSGVGDDLKIQKEGDNYWDKLTVNFIAKAPARS